MVKQRSWGFLCSVGGSLALLIACGASAPTARDARPSSPAESGVTADENATTSDDGDPSAAPITEAPSSDTEKEASDQAVAGSHQANPDSAPDAQERVAFERAEPVFATYCAKCHTSSGASSNKSALRHFDMGQYPFGGHHAADITRTIRNVLGAGNRKATMPLDRPGSVRDEELQRILDWARAYDMAHPEGAAGTHSHH